MLYSKVTQSHNHIVHSLVLTVPQTAPEPVLRRFFTRYLAEVLVGMLADPVEKCREMAGGAYCATWKRK